MDCRSLGIARSPDHRSPRASRAVLGLVTSLVMMMTSVFAGKLTLRLTLYIWNEEPLTFWMPPDPVILFI